MKKFGFTLAEILVTLGVIGIVAALTVPQLVQNINKAHIGPTLQRVVSTIETANIDILRENGVDDIERIAQTPEEYFRLLAQKIPSSSTSFREFPNGEIFISDYAQHGNKSGHRRIWPNTRIFSFDKSIDITFDNEQLHWWNQNGNYKGTYCRFGIDIDGLDHGENRYGRDLFFFDLDKNGTVVPEGSRRFAQLVSWRAGKGEGGPAWDNTAAQNNYRCMKNNVGDGQGCAGSIFDNNLRVIY